MFNQLFAVLLLVSARSTLTLLFLHLSPNYYSLLTDNTFMGPVFQAPFLHGADVVVYSATKFLSGHSDLVAGMVVLKTNRPQQPKTDLSLLQQTKINGYRTILGSTISPDTCGLLTRSLETLWLRMERQAEKAEKVAAALAAHKRVQAVYFP